MNSKKLLSTILVIVWMITMFCFSNQKGTGSSSISKKVSYIIVSILDIRKQIPEEKKEKTVQVIEPIIRKLAHYTLYMIGGILIVNCAYTYLKEDNKVICVSSLIGIFYATSDEVHQLFVDGRSGKIVDVVIDSLGIFTGVAIYLLIKKIVCNVVEKRNKVYKGGRLD